MPKDSFSSEAMNDTNKHWAIAKKRESGIYPRQQDIRSDFARDYTRILHCTAYRRLKHKTQVFFATQNDHICTRIEHVNHVCSIAETIATYLGLNRELTAAISIGHDIGHAPFGHAGEHTLKEIAKKEGIQPFWHEKNSLRFADAIELLEGPKGKFCNLKLTYAVRDGIVCHCGELDENKGIRPRNDNVDLSNISEPGKLDPFTWEGCVVKLADKIAYLGRDIEDAISLKILSEEEREELINIACGIKAFRDGKINNTVLIHKFIIDLCEYSDLSSGVGFSS